MDMETVSQLLLGSHPSLGFLNGTDAGARLLKSHQDKPLVLPLLALLPVLVFSLFRLYTTSPVALFYNKNPATIKLYNKHSGKTREENLVDYIKRKCPSLSDPSRGALFKPTLWMTSGHLQTAYAAYRDFDDVYIIPYDRELLTTPDGGTVSIDWAPSLAKMPADDTPTLVLLHGLTGGSHESYIRALVEKMTRDHGYRCVVFNARACANTELTSAQLYCGSWTEDLRMVVKHIRKVLPEAKLMSVGFSLGANILMNYMGEEGDQCEFLGAITGLAIDRGFLGRNVYSPAMGGNLKRIFMKHTKWFEDSDIVDIEAVKRGRTIRDFDDQVTRKVFKYRTVNEYYRMASSSQRLLDIKRPFLCLSALDDPIAVRECLPYDEIKGNPYGLLATTERGGHLGWFEGFWSQERWCTQPLAEYCMALFNADTRPVSETPSMKPPVKKMATTAAEDGEDSPPEKASLERSNISASSGATTKPVRRLSRSRSQARDRSHHHNHPEEERRQGGGPLRRKSFWATLVPLAVYFLMKRR